MATATAFNQVDLCWNASTDNVGVNSYRIYRNSLLLGTSLTTNYTDLNCASMTTYSYQVAATDASNNESARERCGGGRHAPQLEFIIDNLQGGHDSPPARGRPAPLLQTRTLPITISGTPLRAIRFPVRRRALKQPCFTDECVVCTPGRQLLPDRLRPHAGERGAGQPDHRRRRVALPGAQPNPLYGDAAGRNGQRRPNGPRWCWPMVI